MPKGFSKVSFNGNCHKKTATQLSNINSVSTLTKWSIHWPDSNLDPN